MSAHTPPTQTRASQPLPTPAGSKVTEQPLRSNTTPTLHHDTKTTLCFLLITLQAEPCSFPFLFRFSLPLFHCASVGISTVRALSHDVCILWGRFTPRPQHSRERKRERSRASLFCSFPAARCQNGKPEAF